MFNKNNILEKIILKNKENNKSTKVKLASEELLIEPEDNISINDHYLTINNNCTINLNKLVYIISED